MRQCLQWHGGNLAASCDLDVIPVQLQRAGGPPEGVKEETKQRALLQSNQ